MTADNLWQSMSRDEQEAFGIARMTKLMDRTADIAQRFDAWTIVGSSRLAADNASTEVFRPMTWELHYLMTSALDHLGSIDKLVRVAKSVTPFAPFTLIRSAIESAAVGLWLQNGGTLDKRLFRLIQFQWSHRESVDVHSRSVGIDPTLNTAKLGDMLDATKAKRPGLKQLDYRRKMPRLTDILTETDKVFHPRLNPTGLNTWRSCSGVTHGNVHFTSGMVHTTPLPTPGKGGASQMNIASTGALSLMLMGAVEYLDKLLTTMETHGLPIAGRPDLWSSTPTPNHPGRGPLPHPTS